MQRKSITIDRGWNELQAGLLTYALGNNFLVLLCLPSFPVTDIHQRAKTMRIQRRYRLGITPSCLFSKQFGRIVWHLKSIFYEFILGANCLDVNTL